MALVFPQFLYGWQVYSSGTNQNNTLVFRRPTSTGSSFTATLNAGVYTADEFATEIARAMGVADTGNTYSCAFSYSTLLFTIGGSVGNPFDLMFQAGSKCGKLAGFSETNHINATSFPSDAAAGTAPSTATQWLAADPLQWFSPVTAQAVGTAAQLLRRLPMVVQNRSDGGSIETIYYSTVKRLTLRFNMLAASEQTKMEAFLDWAIQGRRFTFQPDSTSASTIKLVMHVKDVANQFTWATRPETDYGDIDFWEQLS